MTVDIATLRTHLLTLHPRTEWLEQARAHAQAAELQELAAEALIARQRYDEARAHRTTAEGLRRQQRACEGIAEAVR